MTVSQWADKYRRLSSESSAEPGRWRTSKAPYQREIMDAVCDMRVQKVVIMSAAQIGKTDALILNPIGYYMHYDPSPIMVMQPTIQMAETFSKDRLSPMLRDTPVLRDKVNDKSRNSGQHHFAKIFPGGHVTMVGANSPSSLASRPIRILLADEIDRYPATAGQRGRPSVTCRKASLRRFGIKKKSAFSTLPTRKRPASLLNLNTARKKNGTYLVRPAEHSRPYCGRTSYLTGTSWTKSAVPARPAALFQAKRSGKNSTSTENSLRPTRNERFRGFHLNALASCL